MTRSPWFVGPLAGRRSLLLLVPLLLALAMLLSPAGQAPAAVAAGSASAAGPARNYLPPVGHVFVINLENKGYDETWGPGSPAPYLSETLRRQGVLLTQYYGTAHNSLPNYQAQISGQGPDKQTQGACQRYSPFVGAGTVAPGQYVGEGCVFPANVPTLPGQLTTADLTWRGYMEDMGAPCRHPQLGAVDDTQRAEAGDQYAARHNPFVYFASITGSPVCAQNVVDLSQLRTDLTSTRTTRTLSYITPNLCHDAHEAPCVDGEPGGLVSADAWLRQWVPLIVASPAFGKHGLLVTTFDESDSPEADASACCGEGPGPNSPLPGITGLGGGRVGALESSRYARSGTYSTTPLQLLLPPREHRGPVQPDSPRLRCEAWPEPFRPRHLPLTSGSVDGCHLSQRRRQTLGRTHGCRSGPPAACLRSRAGPPLVVPGLVVARYGHGSRADASAHLPDVGRCPIHPWGGKGCRADRLAGVGDLDPPTSDQPGP